MDMEASWSSCTGARISTLHCVMQYSVRINLSVRFLMCIMYIMYEPRKLERNILHLWKFFMLLLLHRQFLHTKVNQNT